MREYGAVSLDERNYGQPLPRGRHGIPKQEVVAHQRERILHAATLELRERGYSSLSVAQITARARVSRVTFYKMFDDKLDCVLAAHGAAVADLEQKVRKSYGAHDDWAEGMDAAVEELLRFAAESPDQMHLILFVNSTASEPKIAKFGLAVRERLIGAIRESRGEADSMPDELSEQAAIGAVTAILGTMLETDEPDRLPEVEEYLIRLVLRLYLGETEAERIALAEAAPDA
jgi:AcrR family transcriptional regulator